MAVVRPSSEDQLNIVDCRRIVAGKLSTQNDMTSCLETFEKERFCGFPQRHGEATAKPESRDVTRGCRKISISCETSSNFHTL